MTVPLDTELSDAELEQIVAHCTVHAERRRLTDQEERARRARAATEAQRIWRAAQPEIGEHGYLRAKGVRPHGIRTNGHELLIPLRDASGEIHSLQRIWPDGSKKNLLNGATTGHYHSIGKPDGCIVVCEGYATGASIHEVTGRAVAVALNSGNLAPVARSLRAKYPHLEIIVAADDDAGIDGNPGLSKATEAARAVGGLLAVPDFGDDRPEAVTDFNDLAKHCGPDAVEVCIEAAYKIPLVARSHTDKSKTSARHTGTVETDTIARLAALDPIEYDRVRVSEAEQLGCRVGTLDAKIQAARPNDPATGNGHTVELWEPEPWQYPVDGAELLGGLSDVMSRYVILPPCAADAIALWVIHAHAHDTAGMSPILAATSPTPECGKTTLITLLGALVPRPLPASNITAAALFRAVEQWRPTLLIDEADTFLRGSDELRGVINSGHARAAAYVIRTTGEDHEPRQFKTWAPKAIASIGKLAPTLSSRAIHIELRRMAPGESVTPLRGDRLDHLRPFARRSVRWVKDHANDLHDFDPDMPGTLRGRTADNWRHMIAIADLVGGDWPERARVAAETLSSGSGDQTAGIMLLEDLQRLYADKGVQVLSSAEIADALKDLEDRPWPEWGRTQKPITQRQIARLLEPFGIRPVKFRADGYTAGTRGYEIKTLSEHFARYLPPVRSATPPQVNGGAGFRDFRSATGSAGVADTDPLKAKRGVGCGAVADQIAGTERF